MYAVVQFGDQFIFQLIAVSREMDQQLVAASKQQGIEGPFKFRHECFLPNAAAPVGDRGVRSNTHHM